MIYQTAREAVAISRKRGAIVQAASTPENWAALKSEASERWIENGEFYFACAERGDEWTVKLARKPEGVS